MASNEGQSMLTAKQRKAAYDMLANPHRFRRMDQSSGKIVLRHHCGWLVAATLGGGREVMLFATKCAAEAAVEIAKKQGCGIRCVEAKFTADEYKILTGD